MVVCVYKGIHSYKATYLLIYWVAVLHLLLQNLVLCESNGYYTFEVKTKASLDSNDRTCSEMISANDVKKVTLPPSPETDFRKCYCYFVLKEMPLHDDNILALSGTGFTTMFLQKSSFSDLRWGFNITSSNGKTAVIFRDKNTNAAHWELKDNSFKIERQDPESYLNLTCHTDETDEDNPGFPGHSVSGETTMPSTTRDGDSGDSTTVLPKIEPADTNSPSKNKPTEDTTISRVTDLEQSASTSDLGKTEASSGDKTSKTLMYILAGALGGGLLLVIIIILVCVYCFIRRKKKGPQNDKRPGSSPSVLYSSLSQTEASRRRDGRPSLKRSTTEDESLPNQAEAVGTTYADIDPKSLVPAAKDGVEKEAEPDTGLTYADLDWRGDSKPEQ